MTPVEAVVMDIEGTTTSIDFVTSVLYPYARERLPNFVRQHRNEPEVEAIMDEAREAGGVFNDEAVVVRQREGDVLVLNQVAARVLQLVSDGLLPSEIGDRVASEYEAPESVIRGDVEKFLEELEKLKILQRSPAAGEAP